MSRTDARAQIVWQTAPWAVAVFAARESVATLEAVVRGIATACIDVPVQIDVLVNGNRELAQDLAQRFELAPLRGNGWAQLRVCFLEVGDKAQTWNVYVHHLYRGAGLTFFVDGYATPQADALVELARGLNEHPQALAATGVPSLGRSADRQRQAMHAGGGIHGNLFVLTRLTMAEIRQRGFRLPMGIYRTDSLIGAVLCFGFDPAHNAWDPSRIRVEATATWRFEALRWWRWKDILTHLKRVGRQTQGTLENLAVRNHLARHRRSPETLPATARDLVLLWWQSEDGPKWHEVLLHPLWLLALCRFRPIRDWSRAAQAPLVLYPCAEQTVGTQATDSTRSSSTPRNEG